MEKFIYHITTKKRWRSTETSRFYTPEGFEQDGFIHCSAANQVLKTARKFYQNGPELVLLKIDCHLVKAQIIWENLDQQPEVFPHIYGKLNLDGVVGVQPFIKAQDGQFEFPLFPLS